MIEFRQRAKEKPNLSLIHVHVQSTRGRFQQVTLGVHPYFTDVDEVTGRFYRDMDLLFLSQSFFDRSQSMESCLHSLKAMKMK